MMPINFVTQLYLPTYNVFARPVTFNPIVSQPNQPSFMARGVFGTQPIDVSTEDNAIFSDAVTILAIIETEFSVLPVQGDTVIINATGDLPEKGSFAIIDADTNGVGETTLTLRRLVVSRP